MSRKGQELHRFPSGERCDECRAKRWYAESGLRYCQNGHRIEVGMIKDTIIELVSIADTGSLGLHRVRHRRGGQFRAAGQGHPQRASIQRESDEAPLRQRGARALPGMPPAYPPQADLVAGTQQRAPRRAGDRRPRPMGPAHPELRRPQERRRLDRWRIRAGVWRRLRDGAVQFASRKRERRVHRHDEDDGQPRQELDVGARAELGPPRALPLSRPLLPGMPDSEPAGARRADLQLGQR